MSLYFAGVCTSIQSAFSGFQSDYSDPLGIFLPLFHPFPIPQQIIQMYYSNIRNTDDDLLCWANYEHQKIREYRASDCGQRPYEKDFFGRLIATMGRASMVLL